MGGGPTQAVILVDSSGERLVITSGRILVDLSGTTITVANVDVSGEVVHLVSGQNNVQISGQAVNISGGVVHEHGSSLLTGPLTTVTDASGGVFLGSGAVFSVTVVNISGNTPVWLGGIGVNNSPHSGRGLIMYGGASVSVKVDSVDDIRVFGQTSGQFVSWIGVVK